jgi:hypothetical protein
MDEALRQLVWDRAADTCEYCRLPQRFDILPFQIDHVIAIKTCRNASLRCRIGGLSLAA